MSLYNPNHELAKLKHEAVVDHIIPRSHGGTDHAHNFQLLCGNCNRQKSNKIQADFLEELQKASIV